MSIVSQPLLSPHNVLKTLPIFLLLLIVFIIKTTRLVIVLPPLCVQLIASLWSPRLTRLLPQPNDQSPHNRVMSIRTSLAMPPESSPLYVALSLSLSHEPTAACLHSPSRILPNLYAIHPLSIHSTLTPLPLQNQPGSLQTKGQQNIVGIIVNIRPRSRNAPTARQTGM